MLTKKRMAWITIILTVVYFFLLFVLLPETIVGTRRLDIGLFVLKVLFLAICTSFLTSSILILMFKNDYIKVQIQTFNRYKYLLFFLIKRDFVSRYRKSILGVLWSLLNPLLTMLIMSIVFSYFFKNQIQYFPVYVLSGQIIYGFFSESSTLAMNSIIAGEGIIKKVYVPKYIFPLSRVSSSLVNLMFSFAAFILVFILTGAPFKWTMLFLPIPLFYTFVFALGVSLALSSLAVFFRDMTYLYSVFLSLLTYLTPLFYPVEILPSRLQSVIGLNPMYQFIDYFRSLALRGIIPGLWTNAVCLSFAFVAFIGGLYIFMSQQDKHILYL